MTAEPSEARVMLLRSYTCLACGTPIEITVEPGYEHNEYAVRCLNPGCEHGPPDGNIHPDDFERAVSPLVVWNRLSGPAPARTP